MAYSIAEAVDSEQDEAACILIYGQAGIGKTTAAASFPKPIILDLDKGLPKGLTVKSFPGKFTTLEQVLEALTSVLHDDHDRMTLIVDNVTKLEKLIHQYLCRKNKWATIESPGYGKGFNEAFAEWQKIIELLKEIRDTRKMMIVVIAHQKVMDFNDALQGAHSRFAPEIHKHVANTLEGEMDAIFWLQPDKSISELKDGRGTVATGGTIVWMNTDRNPAFVAKNRYEMPERILLPKGGAWDIVKKYVPNPHKKG